MHLMNEWQKAFPPESAEQSSWRRVGRRSAHPKWRYRLQGHGRKQKHQSGHGDSLSLPHSPSEPVFTLAHWLFVEDSADKQWAEARQK